MTENTRNALIIYNFKYFITVFLNNWTERNDYCGTNWKEIRETVEWGEDVHAETNVSP